MTKHRKPQTPGEKQLIANMEKWLNGEIAVADSCVSDEQIIEGLRELVREARDSGLMPHEWQKKADEALIPWEAA